MISHHKVATKQAPAVPWTLPSTFSALSEADSIAINLEHISKETLSSAPKGLSVTWDPGPASTDDKTSISRGPSHRAVPGSGGGISHEVHSKPFVGSTAFPNVSSASQHLTVAASNSLL